MNDEGKQGSEEIKDDNSLETIDENNEFTPRLFEPEFHSAKLLTKANGQAKGESQLLIDDELPSASFLTNDPK